MSNTPFFTIPWTQFVTKNHNMACRSDVKDECKKEVKEDNDSSDGESAEDNDVEEAEVRDVKHTLETLFYCLWRYKMFEHNSQRNNVAVPNSVDTYFTLCEPHWPRKELTLKDRNLMVRNITWIFRPVTWILDYDRCHYLHIPSETLDMILKGITWLVLLLASCRCAFGMPEASVYGKRDGYITGLSVISKENQKNSLFRNTPGWKTGCVHDVEMLSRSNMFKPDVPSLQQFQTLFEIWN